MKMLRTIGHSIRDAFKNIFRNFALSFASTFSIAITLFVISMALIVALNVEHFTQDIRNDVTMVVFADRDATAEEIETIDKNIREIENVSSVVYKSKQEEKKDLMQESEAFNDILKEWDDNDLPFQDSFKVKVIEVEEIANTAKTIEKMDKVDTVNYGESMVNNMLSAFDLLNKIMIVIMIVLLIVTIFLIVNTIKLTIESRKREISIMRVVGASNFAIRLPFIFEGMLLGLIGSIIPIIITLYGYSMFYNKFNGHLFSPLITLIEPSLLVNKICIIVLTVGVVVGMIGSASAVRKYLKV